MNSRNTPPGGDGNGLRPRAPGSQSGRASTPAAPQAPTTRRFPASTAYPPLSDKARTPASRQAGAATPGQTVSAPQTRAEAGNDSVNRSSHRVAPGLPPAPRPFGSTRTPPAPEPAAPAEPTAAPVRSNPAAARPAPAPAPSAPAARTTVEAGDPYPPIGGRPMDGIGALMTEKRITPRSPRAALEPEHVPVPTKRRSKRTRNPLVIVGNAIFTLLVLVVIGAGAAVVFGKIRFEAPGPLDTDKVVNIPNRAGLVEIADLLQREGVIDEHKMVFIGGVLAMKARSELKSGEYLFPKKASVRDVVETMMEGKVVQHLITIPEGLTSEQIVARLLDTPILTGAIKEIPPEGSLLPNSYNFKRGDTREQAIQRIRQAQQQVLKEVWERRNRDLPLRTPEQLIILASIIEKETGRPDERTRVAAVFVNRLKQKMRLQTDPTVIYGLAPGKGTLGRPLSRADLEKPTPYNTYMIDALPPGPIANPGRASIEAAASPARTKELYFVADGSGGHAFAETYDQHQRNVARLRVIERNQRAEQQPPDSAAQPAAPPPPPAAKGKRNAKKKQ